MSAADGLYETDFAELGFRVAISVADENDHAALTFREDAIRGRVRLAHRRLDQAAGLPIRTTIPGGTP